MGLLDDAIREHLDLKRRRGADPAEVERAEREALGPVRRAAQEPEEPLLGDELAPEDQFAYDHAQDEGWEEPFAEEYDSDAPQARPQYEPEPGSEVAFEPEAPGPEPSYEPRPLAEEGPYAEKEVEEEPLGHAEAAPEPPASAAPSGGVEEETAEYNIEQEHDEEGGSGATAQEHPRPISFERTRPEPEVPDAPAEEHGEGSTHPGGHSAEEGAEGDDVLEETPDFLQDTPDHDRLWFEQKPPRDFDFDK